MNTKKQTQASQGTPHKDNPQKPDETKAKPDLQTCFYHNRPDRWLAELATHDGEYGFVVYRAKTAKHEFVRQFEDKGRTFVIPAGIEVMHRKGAVLLPTEAAEYTNEARLVREVTAFVHRYVELRQDFEIIAVRYVLFSWLFDRFQELPYLTIRGLGIESGAGKSRALKVVGAICYRPILLGGGSTSAVLRRMIDRFRGTVVLDEADLASSDLCSTFTKILNQGFERGNPLLCCGSDTQNRAPEAFEVFGPKIVVARKRFNDDALESRFLTITMRPRRRADIPINLPADFADEALELRNKLLLYRFRHYWKTYLDSDAHVAGVSDRLAQIGRPLLSTVPDEESRERIADILRTVQRGLAESGRESLAGMIFAAMDALWSGDADERLFVGRIVSHVNDRNELDERLTPQKAGAIVREELGFRTRRAGRGYFVLPDPARRQELRKKYLLGEASY